METPNLTDQDQAQEPSRLARLAFTLSIVMAVSGCLIITNILPLLPGVIFFFLLYLILPLIWLIVVILGVIAIFQHKGSRNLALKALIINALAFLPLAFFWLLATMEGMPFICLEDFRACFGP